LAGESALFSNPMPLIGDCYRKCVLCPRLCGADRRAGFRGFCGETAELRVASASIHRGEEPPLTGEGGSGAVFIAGCNLGCVFCQNYQISQAVRRQTGEKNAALGRVVDTGEFAAICLALRDRGAENINIVTGSHAAPAIAAGIRAVREQGLSLPVLWNTSGYEGAASLVLLKDVVDVYLPDLKTLDSRLAGCFFGAPDYPEHAASAILTMMERRELVYAPGRSNERERILRSGVMIRHLVLPGFLEATREVLRWFGEHCRGRALLSVMTQYTPVQREGFVGRGKGEPSRQLSSGEYEMVLDWLGEFGIEDGFCQELTPGDEWLPDFSWANPFSSELSTPVWHWREGFTG
jgi:putative pyruvate formate lyase activating enzyme